MSWSSPSTLRRQLTSQWEKGKFLSALALHQELFPLRLSLKKPSATELSSRFGEVKDWIASLERSSLRIEKKSVKNRVIGGNEVPEAAWIDRLEQLASFLGKTSELTHFRTLMEVTSEQQPELIPWLARRPFRALEAQQDWREILNVVAWLKGRPRPGIYLRQLDLPGVHTKFLERHKAILAELLFLALPPETLHNDASTFEGRFGFLAPPGRVRLRLLSPCPELPPGLRDLTLAVEELALWPIPVRRVFVTENEVNFHAFPDIPDSLVIFGSGYRVELLARLAWLGQRELYYWGDIDTHGFAILNQLRQAHPHAVSFLMDQRTLFEHRARWVSEDKPAHRELTNLHPEEHELYRQLVENSWGTRVRLEQELVGYSWALAAVEELCTP